MCRAETMQQTKRFKIPLTRRNPRRYRKPERYYDRVGFSERLGSGSRPAVLVIDVRGITEPGPMFIEMSDHIPRINAINEAHARSEHPLSSRLSRTIRISRMQERSDRRCRSFRTCCWMEKDRTSIRDFRSRTDHFWSKVSKRFLRTNLQSQLSGLAIDTTIIVGNSTSGCVRAGV